VGVPIRHRLTHGSTDRTMICGVATVCQPVAFISMCGIRDVREFSIRNSISSWRPQTEWVSILLRQHPE